MVHGLKRLFREISKPNIRKTSIIINQLEKLLDMLENNMCLKVIIYL